MLPHISRISCTRNTLRRFSTSLPRVVVVDGVRTPFLISSTTFTDLSAEALGRYAIKGLLTKTAINPASIDKVITGSVIQETKTTNVARESSLSAGIPNHVPAFTVTLACISSSLAISIGADQIKTGSADIIIASGVETMSDVPIRFSRPIRKRLIGARKLKSPLQYLGLLKGLKLSDLIPEAPSIAEYSTSEVMGHSADRLASLFGVTRLEQDKFALSSHHRAAQAHKDGLLRDEIVPVMVPPKMTVVTTDNGVRGDSTLEKMSSLKPAFIKPHGTVTAANSSYTTDGAAAVLLMSEKKALELGYTPKSFIKDSIFTSQDPKDELLLGPAYAVAKILQRNGLTLNDIDVFEFHEAFAAQIIANLHALESEWFCKEKLGLSKIVGKIPEEKFNTLGGSLSIGHPFGATGCRLVTTASNRLIREGGKYALIAACAAGGQAHACILERY